MLSQRINFEKLLNTRDLGGMTGFNGRKIKTGKLFRSGHLFSASENDLRKLAGLIEVSVDFRTKQECDEKPEPAISGAAAVYNPIFEERQAGVTRDEVSFAEVLSNMIYDAEIARKYMCSSYEGFITNAYCVSQYERFVRMLLEDHEKGVLWHCTAGKDRAGFGTVIIQELLGVSREDIQNDYLMTNVYLAPETEQLKNMIFNQRPDADRAILDKAVSYVFEANIDYLDTAYASVEKHFGNFDNYISKALHITPPERERFRDIYLE